MDRLQLYFFKEHVKEASDKKLSNKEKALMIGGGTAALLGVGGLGYTLRKGAKETDEIVKRTKNSIKRSKNAISKYDKSVKESRDADKLIRKAIKNDKKNIKKMNILGREVEVDMDNGDFSRLSDSSGFGD